MRLALMLIAAVAAQSIALADDTLPAPSRITRFLRTSYAPPFSVRPGPWYLQGIPLSPRERMSQSLCCAMLPVMCGKPQCHAAAMTYSHTEPKHLDRFYLEPFSPELDPAQATRSLIFWAMNPIPSVRTDFIPTYRLYVLGDGASGPHE